jgi:hypothetical protein
MKKISLLLISVLVTVFSHCTQKKTDSTNTETSEAAVEAPRYSLEEVWASEPNLKTPESVIYDPVSNLIYVSNVNENPWEKDGNGSIAKLSPSGEIIEAEWVSGMNGPKGLAIVGNTLYAADLDELIAVDIEKGEIIEKIKIDGASGLNDITSGENGELYISDSNEGEIFQ